MESCIKFEKSPNGKQFKKNLKPDSSFSLDKLKELVNGLLMAYHKMDILEHLNNEEEDKIERLQKQLDFLQEFHENMTEQHNQQLKELGDHV